MRIRIINADGEAVDLPQLVTPCPEGQEDARYCDDCGQSDWESDHAEHDGTETWQEWQCLHCGHWNDKGSD